MAACGATLMSFTPTNSAQTIRFRDNGLGGSELTTLVNGTFDVPIDVAFTFLAPNLSYPVNTTVNAKLMIHAEDGGPMVRLGPGKYVQPLMNFSFSFTDPVSGVNFLSGTGDYVLLASQSGGALFEMYYSDGLQFTSDVFRLNGATDETQGMLLNFSGMQLGFVDTNSNGIMDSQNIASVSGSARAEALPVPEPGSALLVAMAIIYSLRRSRGLRRA